MIVEEPMCELARILLVNKNTAYECCTKALVSPAASGFAMTCATCTTVPSVCVDGTTDVTSGGAITVAFPLCSVTEMETGVANVDSGLSVTVLIIVLAGTTATAELDVGDIAPA